MFNALNAVPNFLPSFPGSHLNVGPTLTFGQLLYFNVKIGLLEPIVGCLVFLIT